MCRGNPNVGEAVEHALDRDSSVGTYERCTWARVDTATERDVLARVVTVGAELGRALEAAGVAVAAGQEQHDGAARGNFDASDDGGLSCHAHVDLHGAVEAQHLLDEVRNALA